MGKFGMKAFYLDPHVLLQAPTAIIAFDDNVVVLPDTVFRYLSDVMRKNGEEGSNAKDALKILNGILEGRPLQNDEALFESRTWELPNRGCLIIDGLSQRDCGIIEKASNYFNGQTRHEMQHVFVTQNPALQAEARFRGMNVEPYRGNIDIKKEPYTGRREMLLPTESIGRLYKTGMLAMPKSDCGLVHNEYVIIKAEDGSSSSVMAYYDAVDNMLRVIKMNTGNGVYGVRPKNAGQHFALDALMRPVDECPLVILQGGAGTAKTFLALAAGLEQTVGAAEGYRRILVVRPNVKFDSTLGFLKGGEADKIAPLIRPIMDNIDQLTAVKSEKTDYAPRPKKGRRSFADEDATDKIVAPNSYAQDLFDSGRIVAQSMEYMRGRSITDTYIIIDEAQNMTPEQAFGIISRAGKGTKIVLEGDPNQVDNPSLSSRTNGLTWASQCMKDSRLCAQLMFSDHECERSALAAEAILRMSPKGV